MADGTRGTWACPKDGTAMERKGRRGPWRCPECRGVFFDTAAMRGGRKGPPVLTSVFTSVFWSVLATVVVRKMRARKDRRPQE